MARIYGQQEFVRYVNAAGLIDIGGFAVGLPPTLPAVGGIVYVDAAGLMGVSLGATLTQAGALTLVGAIIANTAEFRERILCPPAVGTDGSYVRFQNALGDAWFGVESNAGATTFVGAFASPNRTVINSLLDIEFWRAGNLVLLCSAGGVTAPAGIRVGTNILMTSTVALTDNFGVGAGTLLNAPAAGNPTKWIAINDNGTPRFIPTWS